MVSGSTLKLLGRLWFFILAMGCGQKKADESAPAPVGTPAPTYTNFTSAIKNIDGNQSEMSGWVVVFIERDTGVCRVADIGPAGNYAVSNLSSKAQTVALLDPSYRFSSVLSFPGANQGSVRQYFKATGKFLPTLVHRGPIVTFADMAGINIEPEAAADSDFDGIPNGTEPPAGLALAETEIQVDTDLDGIPNAKDSDIDGDGIVNWLDPDDNGNLIPDIFDPDADGNGVADQVENTGDYHFKQVVDYMTMQIVQETQVGDKGALSLTSSMIFTMKVRDSASVNSIKVRGPEAALFQGSQAAIADLGTGKSTNVAWDKTLADDGLNEDGNPGDGVYSRKIVLDKSKAPKGNQVIFFSVDTKVAGDKAMVLEFPALVPNVTSGGIKGVWDNKSKILTMSGTPFAEVDSSYFIWSVHVFNGDGQKVYSSEPISAKTETYTIPTSFIEPDTTYKATIVVQSLDRIQGFPDWIIKSPSVELK